MIEAGFTDIGQGARTIFPQIAASVLGVRPDMIELRAGDSTLPFAGPTYGSGTTIGMGAAVLDAARKVRDRLAELAGWPADEVTCVDARLHRGPSRIALRERPSRWAIRLSSPTAICRTVCSAISP